jgi:hypothetical protein
MHEHIQFIASLSHIRPLKYICWLYLCSYLPVCTSELLESATEKSIDKWLASEGVDSVAEAECVVLESLSSHVRTVVATLGGKQGAASRFDKWQYLHAGFTVWLSVSDASGKETRKGRLALFCS